MKNSPIQHILNDVTPMKQDNYCFPRYHIPHFHFPVGPGSQEANDIGLYKYRGYKLGKGFVLPSRSLETDLIKVLRALGVKIPEEECARQVQIRPGHGPGFHSSLACVMPTNAFGRTEDFPNDLTLSRPTMLRDGGRRDSSLPCPNYTICASSSPDRRSAD